MKKISLVSADELVSEAVKKINSVNTVFDIGCGIRPQTLTQAFFHICIDAHKQYLDILKKEHRRSLPVQTRMKFMYFNRTTDWIISVFKKPIVDSVFFLDVIEHLEKEKGMELIKTFSKIATHQVVLFTPLGFVKQEHPDGKDAWGLDGGKWQEHKSGWTPDDFDDTWEFVLCKDFHKNDNLGNIHQDDVGAFFAIKTIGPKPGLLSVRNKAARIYFKILFRLKFSKYKFVQAQV